MLIEFNVTNFRSIKETQTLNMAANNTKGLENNYFDSGVKGIPRLLSSVAMYGANAAGKSNFVEAISFMCDFVLNSSKKLQQGDSIAVTPFKFDNENRTAPSEFEVIFIKDNTRFQYGFSATSDRVISEWLFAYPEGRSQRWFERSFDFQSNSDDWYFGSKFHGNRQLWKNSTRKNALFLSTAIQLNSEQLNPVFDWFDNIRALTNNALSPRFTISLCETEKYKRPILDFMNNRTGATEAILEYTNKC